ncbi:MAG TPA: manganese efflux pump [Candidatus Baltobacteraceae bacterium]
MTAVIKIAVVALSLALDVFAVSIGVGVRGASTAAKIRIGIAFAGAEILMNLIGAGLGLALGHLIGTVAGYFGFAALFGLGTYMIVESLREAKQHRPLDMSRGWGLVIAALSISLDSLGIGFSILYIGVPLVAALTTIGVVSVAATTLGVTLGRMLGSRVEERAEMFAGIILALTGVAFAALKALNIG